MVELLAIDAAQRLIVGDVIDQHGVISLLRSPAKKGVDILLLTIERLVKLRFEAGSPRILGARLH